MIFATIFLINCVVLGLVTAHARVYYNSWPFWVINLCHASAYTLGTWYERSL